MRNEECGVAHGAPGVAGARRMSGVGIAPLNIVQDNSVFVSLGYSFTVLLLEGWEFLPS